MSLLDRLFGRRKPAPAAPPPPAVEARPARPGAFGDSPLHRLLDEAGLPWRETRGELTARFGTEIDPAYDWEVLPLPGETPPLDGLIRPFTARSGLDLAPQHPPTDFSAAAWWVPDARDNIQRAFDTLAPRLGQARIARRANTLHCAWTFGAAALELTAWPDDLPAYDVPAQERDPRLASACHIYIRTGWRILPSAEEAAWLESFQPLFPQSEKTSPRQLRAGPVPETHLEFIREPPATPGPWLDALGVSAGGEALIWTEGQLHLVPVADVVRLKLQRMLPAKGGGGAWLSADVLTGYPATPVKTLTLAAATGTEDLNAPARKLAQAIGRPLEIGQPTYDV